MSDASTQNISKASTKPRSESSEVSESLSIKSQVFHELDRNHLLRARILCKMLDLSFKKYQGYINNLRSQWKTNYRNGLASKRPNFHNWRGWAYVPLSVDRERALERGWILSKNRNRVFAFTDRRLGRLEWFETGRVNVWLRKPANQGKKGQLLSNAFFETGLISDARVLGAFVDSVRYNGAHLTYDVGERLPYARIDCLKESLGIVVKTGDLSHPTDIEIEFHMPKWAEDAIEDRRAFIETTRRLINSGEHRPDKNVGVI